MVEGLGWIGEGGGRERREGEGRGERESKNDSGIIYGKSEE